jgi:hypothetical protein
MVRRILISRSEPKMAEARMGQCFQGFPGFTYNNGRRGTVRIETAAAPAASGV